MKAIKFFKNKRYLSIDNNTHQSVYRQLSTSRSSALPSLEVTLGIGFVYLSPSLNFSVVFERSSG